MQLNDEKIKQLAKKLKMQFPQIAFAYLFGSIISEQVSESSDLDLAVFLKPDTKTPELITSIIGLVEMEIPEFPCDLLILNDAGKLIAMEVLKGKILFIRDTCQDDHAGFYSITCRMFEDQQAWMKKQLKYRGHEVQWNN